MAKKNKKNQPMKNVPTIGTSRGYRQTPTGKTVQYREGLKKNVKVDPDTKTVHKNPHGGSTMETKAVRTVKGQNAKGQTEYGRWRPNTSSTTYEKGNMRSYMPKSSFKVPEKFETSKIKVPTKSKNSHYKDKPWPGV